MGRRYKNFKDYREVFTNIIDENTRINKEAGAINGVCVFRKESRNNRVYLPKAEKAILGFMEGAKCFQDHGGMFTGQSVGSLIGEFHNPRRHNKGVYADLEVLENAKDKNLLFEIAESKPHLAGFSINARGKFADEPDDQGREQVTDVIALYSTDWVGNPACTNGMFEEKNNEEEEDENKSISSKTKGGESRMDSILTYLEGKVKTKGLTEDGQAKAVVDYIQTLEEQNESTSDAIAQLTEDSKSFKEKLAEKEKELSSSKDELKTVQIKLKNYEDAEATAKKAKERKEVIEKVLKEEKLDKKYTSDAFINLLMEIEADEDKIRELIKDRKVHLKPVDEVNIGDEQKSEGDNGSGEPKKLTKDEIKQQLREVIKAQSQL